MPYKVFMESGKHKVYKLGEDGKKVGKPLGEHDSPGKAQAQVRALYANDKKPKKEIESTEEVVEESEEKGIYVGDAYISEPLQVEVVNPVPGPLSFADLMAQHEAQEKAWKMEELTYQFQQLSRNIMHSEIENKAEALTTLANEYTTLMQECMTEEMEDEKSLLKQIAGDNQPSKPDTPKQEPESTPTPGEDSLKQDTQSLYIWKEGEIYKWLAAYSNNRRDNDNPPEIISSESHKEFDQALYNKEWPMPEAWLWHIDYPVGVTDYHAYDESTGFPVAAGHFYKGMEWAAEGIVKAKWNGVSHGMPNDWIKRDENDPTILIRHRTKEITFLPQWAAANKLAFNIISKESNMSDEQKGLPAHKREEFIKAFGEDKVQEIEQALEGRAKEADEAGIEKKEVEELTPDSPIVKVLKDIIDSLSSLETRLKALEEKPTEVEKEEPFDLVAFLQGKSAIGKPETKVDGRSTLAKDKPEEVEQPSVTQAVGGIRISLADQFIGANQAWYQDKGGK